MHEKVSHITMLQRSPGYFVSVPETDSINTFIQKWLPTSWAGWLLRIRFLLGFHVFYYWCQLFPNKARQFLINQTAKELPSDLSVNPHFVPSYRPWEQRMCVALGGDFFRALRSGKASVATGHIDTVTENGICLKDGQTIDADIIITATGLKMQYLGGASLKIDGSEPIRIGDKFLWRGAMLQDVPNLAFYMGYTNASWTLGSDATARMFVRLLQELKRRGASSAVATIAEDSKVKEVSMMNLSSGYIKTAMENNILPQCGDVAPWKPRRSYFLDSWFIKYGDISSELVYTASSTP
jgi:cation diffusion facilitator CzcD-associated flavoprotein CzcO